MRVIMRNMDRTLCAIAVGFVDYWVNRKNPPRLTSRDDAITDDQWRSAAELMWLSCGCRAHKHPPVAAAINSTTSTHASSYPRPPARDAIVSNGRAS